MAVVLDDYARREAQILIEQLGDRALACAHERAAEAARRGQAIVVALWEIVAFEIMQLSDNLPASPRSG
jgi:hypothetical protein